MHSTNHEIKDFAIEAGQCFRRETIVFRITRAFSEQLEIEDVQTLARKIMPKSDLIQNYLALKILPCSALEVERAIAGDHFLEDDTPVVAEPGFSNASPKAAERARYLLKYINALQQRGYDSISKTPLLTLELEKLGREFSDPNPPSAGTVAEHHRKILRASGDKLALLPAYSQRGGKGNSRLAHAIEEQMEILLTELEQDRDRRVNYVKLHHELEARIGRVVSGPYKTTSDFTSEATVARRVKDRLGAYEIHRRNFGKVAADKKYRTWTPRDKALSPTEVVEFDDKDTKVFGIDLVTKLPVGRMFTTQGVSQSTLVPMGFAIGSKPRDKHSAIEAFVNCCLPKDLSQPEFLDVEGKTDYSGGIAIAVFDNALYNHSKLLATAVYDISNTTIAFARPGTPTEKSVVENFNGVMARDFLSNLPGYGGPKGSDGFVDEGMATAVMDVQTFRNYLMRWVYMDYCLKRGSDGLSPQQRWLNGMANVKSRYPANLRKVHLACMEEVTRRLRTEQLNYKGLIYQSERLQQVRRMIGYNANVRFKFNERHIEFVYVHDPRLDEWFEVPNAHPEYSTGMSHYQHGLVKKLMQESGVKSDDIRFYLEFKLRLAEDVQKLRFSEKYKERKRAERITSSNPDIFSPEITRVASETVSEIEYVMSELEDVQVRPEGEADEWTL